MGPDAFRVAGLTEALEGLGHKVQDAGNLRPRPAVTPGEMPNHVHEPAETIGWTEALAGAAEAAMQEGVCSGWGQNDTLSVFSMSFHYVEHGVFAYAEITCNPSV
jgi:arginase